MPYNIQGEIVHPGREPFLRNGKLYVPLRGLVEALGGTVSVDGKTKAATVSIGKWTATVLLLNPKVDVSGIPVTLSAEPYAERHDLFVPYDFFHDAFGYAVSAAEGTVYISNPNA